MAERKGQWIAKPSLRHLKGRLHIVTEVGEYLAADGTGWIIPVGFTTDGASVPRFLWWLYPPFGDDYEASAVLHDYIYQCAELFPGDDRGHIGRGAGDALFREAMEADGFRASGRAVVYRGVRAGGWKAWRKHRRDARESRGQLAPVNSLDLTSLVQPHACRPESATSDGRGRSWRTQSE